MGSRPPKFLAYPVILCFEKRCPKQNTAARIKSNILAHTNLLPPQNFWLATPLPNLILWSHIYANRKNAFMA